MGDLSRIEILPQAFLSRMREMLGDEYEEFLESYQKPLRASCQYIKNHLRRI